MKKTNITVSLVLIIALCFAAIGFVSCGKGGGTTAQGGTSTVEKELQQEIATLKAQNAALAKEKADWDFDYAALQSELEKAKVQAEELENQVRQLDDHNKALQDENGALNDEVVLLNQTIAEKEVAYQEEKVILEEKVIELSQAFEEKEAEAQEEIARLSQVLEANGIAVPGKEAGQVAGGQDAAAVAGGQDAAAVADGQDAAAVAAKKSNSQVRNVIGVKFGPDMVDLEATFAIMPHVFLIASAGMAGTPEHYVEDEFPGYVSNNDLFSGKYNFFYDALGGLGFNWQFNSLPAQPNVYLSTMVGPAWFLYKEDGDLTSNTHLLWRTSLGFDMTIYKNILFTADLGVDWMKDYDFTPRLAIGVLWKYSNWALFGGRKNK